MHSQKALHQATPDPGIRSPAESNREESNWEGMNLVVGGLKDPNRVMKARGLMGHSLMSDLVMRTRSPADHGLASNPAMRTRDPTKPSLMSNPAMKARDPAGRSLASGPVMRTRGPMGHSLVGSLAGVDL
ncbi:hypothetical protein Acor_32240 [Acrocarpospora corrugata]|uniref:Uncharacterized protein n=1 Tax=Acrocarpospora corrugata TaxID=35763 RepID=A0A5M3VYY9_9ACTN|nr:hypothetical protein Acor_32240 [Acrocarpospora corrugata]